MQKKGNFKQIGNSPILVLNEGATITIKNDDVTNISFSKSDFSLADIDTNTTTYKTNIQEDIVVYICIQGNTHSNYIINF